MKRSSLLLLLLPALLAASCSSSDDNAASSATPTPTASPTPAVQAKPGCTALSDLSLKYFATAKHEGIDTLEATEGWVVAGPTNNPPAYSIAVKLTAAGRTPGEVGTFVGFAQQPGERDDVLVFSVDPVAQAVTNLQPISGSSSLKVTPTDPTLVAAKACFS